MIVHEGPLPGLLVLDTPVHRDGRGSFRELWQRPRYLAAGLPAHFAQDNASHSGRGVLRGLHFQHPDGQGKLVSVLHGELFDVAVDVRIGSPTFGRWAGYRLAADRGRQLYVPPGMAHGVLALSDDVVLTYKCTALRAPGREWVLRWDDPDVGVAWPLDGVPALSAADADGRRLRDFPLDALPQYRPPDHAAARRSLAAMATAGVSAVPIAGTSATEVR